MQTDVLSFLIHSFPLQKKLIKWDLRAIALLANPKTRKMRNVLFIIKANHFIEGPSTFSSFAAAAVIVSNFALKLNLPGHIYCRDILMNRVATKSEFNCLHA